MKLTINDHFTGESMRFKRYLYLISLLFSINVVADNKVWYGQATIENHDSKAVLKCGSYGFSSPTAVGNAFTSNNVITLTYGISTPYSYKTQDGSRAAIISIVGPSNFSAKEYYTLYYGNPYDKNYTTSFNYMMEVPSDTWDKVYESKLDIAVKSFNSTTLQYFGYSNPSGESTRDDWSFQKRYFGMDPRNSWVKSEDALSEKKGLINKKMSCKTCLPYIYSSNDIQNKSTKDSMNSVVVYEHQYILNNGSTSQSLEFVSHKLKNSSNILTKIGIRCEIFKDIASAREYDNKKSPAPIGSADYKGPLGAIYLFGDVYDYPKTEKWKCVYGSEIYDHENVSSINYDAPPGCNPTGGRDPGLVGTVGGGNNYFEGILKFNGIDYQ